MESPVASCLSVFITCWALVGDYIRILTVNAQHDALFLPGTVACIAWFTIEAGACSRALALIRLIPQRSLSLTPLLPCARIR